MNVNDLTANVCSPNGRVDDAQIIETEDANYSIRFIPKVKYKGKSLVFHVLLQNYEFISIFNVLLSIQHFEYRFFAEIFLSIQNFESILIFDISLSIKNFQSRFIVGFFLPIQNFKFIFIFYIVLSIQNFGFIFK